MSATNRFDHSIPRIKLPQAAPVAGPQHPDDRTAARAAAAYAAFCADYDARLAAFCAASASSDINPTNADYAAAAINAGNYLINLPIHPRALFALNNYHKIRNNAFIYAARAAAIDAGRAGPP